MADDNEKPKVDKKIEKEKVTQPLTTTPAKGNTDIPIKSGDNSDNTPQNGNSTTAAVQDDEKKKDTNKVSTTTTKIEGNNGNTEPTNNNTSTTTAGDKNDETSMKEKLLKKKLSQKKIRRTKSQDDSTKSNSSKHENGDKKKKGGEGGDQKKDNDRRGRKRRSSEDQHRRGGGKGGGHGHHNGRGGRDGYRGGPPQRDWPPQREFGGRGDPYYGRGGPGPRDYRGGGDMYGRGPPGGGWGNDRGRYDDRRGPPPGRDYDYDQRFGGGRRDERERDIYGRGYNNGPPPPPMQQQEKSRSGSISSKGSRSYSRSRSRSYSSRSRSGSRSYSSHSSRGSSRSHSRSYSRSPSRDSGIKKKRSSGSHSRGSRDRSSSPAAEVDETTKDQRTIFVSQLVMRADERDISRYFKRKVGTKVRDVILLRDKRTGRHKGCAYVELSSEKDVDRALKATGKIPEFQRFPIMIKRSEAEKNLPGSSTSTAVFTPPGASSSTNHGGQPVQLNEDGKRIEAKQVYVGHIDRCVTQAQLYALFSQFGQLDKVILQMDMSTMISKGFGFLTYRDPKDANLAIQTMSGQMLAGKPLKTGWAITQSSAAGVIQVETDDFPDDANAKIEKVNEAMKTLTGTTLTNMIGSVNPAAKEALKAAGPAGKLGIMPKSQLASVADATLDEALGVAPSASGSSSALPVATPASAVDDAKVVGRSEKPSQHILVHNMYDKDEETEQNWQNDIKEDFEEEVAQFGKITNVVVMYKEVGGKIYASFDTVEGATNCAKSLAGRWFDKRQLRVEFVDSIPVSA